MFRAPPMERPCPTEKPAGSTFRDKVLGLFKQRQQSPSSQATKESKPFAFRLKRTSMPVRKRSRRGLSRFMQKDQSSRKEFPKAEEIRASLRLIEDIYHMDDEENENIHDIEDELQSFSSEHTEPRDNRTNSKLNLGLSRSDMSRGWSRTPDSSKELEVTHMSSPFRTSRTSPRSPQVSSLPSPKLKTTSSVGQFGLSRQGSVMHLHDSGLHDSNAPMNTRRSMPSKMQSRRSTISRTESPSSDKDSLKPPRTNGKPGHSEHKAKDLSPPSDPSPKDVTQPIYPVGALGQGSYAMGRPTSRRIVPEPLKPRFREFPLKYPSQPMLSVPECGTLPPRLSDAAAPDDEPTPYLPGFSEGDYVDDERMERILKLIQLQKTEMENKDTRSRSCMEALSPMPPCAAMPPRSTSSLPTSSQGFNHQPGFDAKDYVDDDQLDLVLKNLQDRDLGLKQPSSFNGRGVARPCQSYRSSQLKPAPQDVMSPLRLTFSKHDSIPIIRREVYRTYSLPSITSIVRV